MYIIFMSNCYVYNIYELIVMYIIFMYLLHLLLVYFNILISLGNKNKCSQISAIIHSISSYRI